MFFDKSLQEGIAKALAESKAVVCFVTDGRDTSQKWEDLITTDDKIRATLDSKAVVIKLISDSQETSFLRAYFPTKEAPNLAIIHPSGTKALLSTDVAFDALAVSICDYVDGNGATLGASNVQIAGGNDTSTAEEQTSAAVGPSASQRVEDQLSARRARLEAAKEEADKKEKADRAAKLKAQKDAAQADPSSKAALELKYAQQRKDRLKSEKEDRQRILKRLEDDKQERKEKEQRRREEAQALAQDQAALAKGKDASSDDSEPKERGCALQVRLFDGRSVRCTFAPEATLSKEVRAWIDSLDPTQNAAYTFKFLKSPSETQILDIKEETETLKSLGLTPNATLALAPVRTFAGAYDGAGDGLFSWGYNVVASGIGYVGSTIARVGGSEASEVEGSERDHLATGSSTGRESTVRTLRDDKYKGEKHQLYNGNQLNFEPRPDDDTDAK